MSSKTIWGNAVWYLIHTLAYKIKDDKNIKELISYIIEICSNIPCPECRLHAMNILNTSNIKNINSKQELILFLMMFHNIINEKLGKPKFTEEENNNTYSRANTVNIIKNYFNVIQIKKYNSRVMIDTYRQRLFLKKFKIYINNHINDYLP